MLQASLPSLFNNSKDKKMKNPTLSIIIPVYNKGNYLAKCLTSIIDQSYKNLEVILINDGSTDNSEEIAQRYQIIDQRIKVYTFPNSGVSAARNRGIAMAQGEFILFIDADDWIEADYLQRVMHHTEQENADIYIWGITKETENGQYSLTPSLNGILTQEEFLKAFVKEQYKTQRGLYGYISNKLLRREIIQKNNICFNQTIKQLEDYDFFLSYYDHAQTVCLFSETGYHYVTGTAYSSGSMIKHVNFIGMIEIHLKCQRILQQHNCLTTENRKLIAQAINGLALAMFLEMPTVTLSDIRHSISLLEERHDILTSLQTYQTKFRQLKSLILKKQIFLLYLYIHIWKSYLSIRKRI